MSAFEIVPASSITSRPIRWLWQDRLPLGKITFLAGDGGLGKSTATVKLAADLSKGKLDGDLRGESHGTLILTTEDDADDTIVPRLIAADADLDRVHLQKEDADDFEGVDALAERIDGCGVKLVALDPILDFLPATLRTGDNHSIGRALNPWKRFARSHDVAVLGIAHINQNEAGDVSTRIAGAAGFRNKARSVLIFGSDPDDPEGRDGSRRVIAQEKKNLTRHSASLAGRIEDVEVFGGEEGRTVLRTSRFVIDGTSDARAEDIVKSWSARDQEREQRESRSDAERFLLNVLADGPRRATEVTNEARDALGLSERMLRTARGKLGVRTEQKRDGWWWTLPSDDRSDAVCLDASSESSGSSGSSAPMAVAA